MGFIEIMLVGVGLAMDATAVSICKGLSMKKLVWKNAVIIALYFGIFQAVMPLLGYLFGSAFSGLVEAVDHWIAFILLSIIGGKMIKESFEDEGESETKNDSIDVKTMIVMAIATSIDALAVGITFAFFKINIIKAILIIGIITFTLSLFGVIIGNKFGDKFHGKAEIVGGVILILIGIKIFLEHSGFSPSLI